MLELDDEPQHYPDCCLSISTRLLQGLANLIEPIATQAEHDVYLISIGCGTGLLEAELSEHLIQRGLRNVRIEGVEVASASAKFLSSAHVHYVPGTWNIYEGAQNANVLMFVYPRTGQLVATYLQQCSRNAALAFWLGPRVDFIDQLPLLRNVATFTDPLIIEEPGLASYELAAVFKNSNAAALRKGSLQSSRLGLADEEIDRI